MRLLVASLMVGAIALAVRTGTPIFASTDVLGDPVHQHDIGFRFAGWLPVPDQLGPVPRVGSGDCDAQCHRYRVTSSGNTDHAKPRFGVKIAIPPPSSPDHASGSGV